MDVYEEAAREQSVIRTWLEYVLEMPRKKRSDDNLDLKRAREVTPPSDLLQKPNADR